MKGRFTGSGSVVNLLRLGSLIAIGVGLFAVGLAAVLLYGSMQAQLANEQASRAAEDRARNIASALSSIQATLRDPQVLAFARLAVDQPGGTTAELNQAVRARGVQNILDLRAFPVEVESIELGDYPEPDFTVIEMLLEARRDRQALIQVHYPGTANENLAFAQNIENGGDSAGVLFLRTPVSTVTSLLNDPGILDYVALVQMRSERPAVLKSLGVAGARVRSTEIAGSRLALNWSRSTMVGPLDGQAAIILGASGIILLMIGLLIRRQTRVAEVIAPERSSRAAPPEAPAKADPPPAERKAASPRKAAAARPDPPEPQREDLPDWLLDSDADGAEADPFSESDPPPGDSLPRLPDTLDESEDTARMKQPGGDGKAPTDTSDTVFMDGDSDEFFAPEERAEGSVDETPEADRPGQRNERPDEITSFAAASDSQPSRLKADEPDSLDDNLYDDAIDFSDGTEDLPDFEVEPEPEPEPEPRPEPAKPEPKPKPKNKRPPVLDPALLGVGQISGIVEDTLDARSATLIGQAIGSEARARGIDRIVVARDGRLYGAVLLSSLSQGLRATGVNVIDIGAVPTPVLNFAAAELTQGSSVMVTGSHYPPERNGFRIRLGGELLHEAGLGKLFERLQDDDLASGQGEIEEQSVTERYIERVSIDIQLERPLKVVVDCGNGIAGSLAPQVLSAIGADVIPLYADVDGNFPNHHPNPAVPDNLEDLKLCVRNFQADLGLAFDGDGDRLGVISNDGSTVWPDRLLMLLAGDLLERQSDAVIVHDVECSSHLTEMIDAAGGRAVQTRCNEAFVAASMVAEQAQLGGLLSGNLFVAERWFPFEDAIYASARLLELFAADTRAPSERLAELPEMEATGQIRVPVDDQAQAEKLISALQANGDFGQAEVSNLDGVRADYPDGWGLVRASHAAAELVLRFEGSDDKALNRIKTLFKKQIKAQAPDLKLLF